MRSLLSLTANNCLVLTIILGIVHAKRQYCGRNNTFVIYELFDGPLIEADGSIVTNSSVASTGIGQRWPFVGQVYNTDVKSMQTSVGTGRELCTRLNSAQYWLCEGSYQNLYGCSGSLAFSGIFSDETSTGEYTIVGGTGNFVRARGQINDVFSYSSGYSVRTISLK